MVYAILQNQGSREYMEDTYVAETNIVDGIDIFGVFDGHAGSYVTDYLRDNIKNAFISNVQRYSGSKSMDDILYFTIRQLHKSLDAGRAHGTGSTCLVAVRFNNVLTIANVGDCRAIVNIGSDACRVTKDHKPDVPKEYKRIVEDGGFVTAYPHDVPRVNGMLAVSRSLGDLYLSPHVRWEPEVSTLKILSTINVLILGSDGVWDTMTDQDVIDIYTRTQNDYIRVTEATLSVCARMIIEEAQRRGSEDNITVIIVSL